MAAKVEDREQKKTSGEITARDVIQAGLTEEAKIALESMVRVVRKRRVSPPRHLPQYDYYLVT